MERILCRHRVLGLVLLILPRWPRARHQSRRRDEVAAISRQSARGGEGSLGSIGKGNDLLLAAHRTHLVLVRSLPRLQLHRVVLDLLPLGLDLRLHVSSLCLCQSSSRCHHRLESLPLVVAELEVGRAALLLVSSSTAGLHTSRLQDLQGPPGGWVHSSSSNMGSNELPHEEPVGGRLEVGSGGLRGHIVPELGVRPLAEVDAGEGTL
eukprot:16452353-Heterocapsa_arctica.AAC.1